MNNRKGCVIGTKLHNDKYGEKKSDKKSPYKQFDPEKKPVTTTKLPGGKEIPVTEA